MRSPEEIRKLMFNTIVEAEPAVKVSIGDGSRIVRLIYDALIAERIIAAPKSSRKVTAKKKTPSRGKK